MVNGQHHDRHLIQIVIAAKIWRLDRHQWSMVNIDMTVIRFKLQVSSMM